MTFDRWKGCFKNMLSNLVCPSPTRCQVLALYLKARRNAQPQAFIHTCCFIVDSLTLKYNQLSFGVLLCCLLSCCTMLHLVFIYKVNLLTIISQRIKKLRKNIEFNVIAPIYCRSLYRHSRSKCSSTRSNSSEAKLISGLS